jgi:molybdopterin-guanine dinucleotide biosynthesis protein A
VSFKVPAVITAGGRIEGEFADTAKTSVKALVPLQGISLVERVLAGLVQSERIADPVLVVGPEVDLRMSLGESASSVRFLEEGVSGPENMVRGLSAVGESGANGWAILCTCDVPFLTGDAVRWLLDSAPDEADIVFPILTKAEYEAAFPGSPGTYVGIEGEQYTGGSVFLVRPSAIIRNRALIKRVFEARKSVFAMARLGGFGLVGRLMTRTLTVEYVEARASLLTGCRCRALRHAPASLVADIDTMEDYRYACGLLADQGTRV